MKLKFEARFETLFWLAMSARAFQIRVKISAATFRAKVVLGITTEVISAAVRTVIATMAISESAKT